MYFEKSDDIVIDSEEKMSFECLLTLYVRIFEISYKSIIVVNGQRSSSVCIVISLVDQLFTQYIPYV
jgi:hypothetical protein